MLIRLLLAMTASIIFSTWAHAQDALTGMYRLTRQAADIVEPDLAREFEKQKIFKKVCF